MLPYIGKKLRTRKKRPLEELKTIESYHLSLSGGMFCRGMLHRGMFYRGMLHRGMFYHGMFYHGMFDHGMLRRRVKLIRSDVKSTHVSIYKKENVVLCCE